MAFLNRGVRFCAAVGWNSGLETTVTDLDARTDRVRAIVNGNFGTVISREGDKMLSSGRPTLASASLGA